ncbi:MAG: DUF1302 family protein [Pseudomonadota bacterium]
MVVTNNSLWGRLLSVCTLCTALSQPVHAIDFKLPFGDDGIEGVLNTTTTFGAQVRMQDRSADLVGKSNIDPNVCGRIGIGNNPAPTGTQVVGSPLYQSCQGLFRTQSYPAARLGQVPGQYSLNFDDGNLNYDKHDLTQAPLKITQDISLTQGDYGFFARALVFHDFVNNGLKERHPNQLTLANASRSGFAATALNNNGLARTDSVPCGDRVLPGTPCGLVYGSGQAERTKRDSETLRQIGQGFQLLDAVFYGKVKLGEEQDLTVKFGRQTINWGESTLLVINSINQAQPVNANNFQRTGFAVEEVFTPQTSLYLSGQPLEGLTFETFYQFEWSPVEIPAKGSYFSFADLGTDNAGSFAISSFGGAAEDPDGVGFLLDNALSGLTNTSLRVPRLRDRTPKNFGFTNQYGGSLKYYAEWLNSGTELGLYFINYHSKLPYISVFAAENSCGRDSRSSTQFVMDCPDLPILNQATDPNNPAGATSDPILFDTARIQFEYPENIQMVGFSFNTTVGDFSLQGEIAYRPNLPLQVDVEDLVFAAYGPTLTRCHNPDISTSSADNRTGACAGTGTASGSLTQPILALLPPALSNALTTAAANGPVGGVGTDENGNTMVYPSSDYVLDAAGTLGSYRDTFDLVVGHGVGSARAFPSFVTAYRGGAVGENAGSDPTRPYNNDNPGYIRGYERMEVYQFNLGATQVLGATDNFIGADQIINLFEVGATWVPGLPSLDVLQFEAPGTLTHASAGADGSGADRSRQACSTNPTCSFGPDGLRFNPTQADLDLYPDNFSWGYRIISLIRYESVLPGISLQPMIIWQHDMNGTAPQPLDTNFVEGRKNASVNIEVRYKSALSIVPGYTWFTGGADGANTYKDRDFAQLYVKYQF